MRHQNGDRMKIQRSLRQGLEKSPTCGTLFPSMLDTPTLMVLLGFVIIIAARSS